MDAYHMQMKAFVRELEGGWNCASAGPASKIGRHWGGGGELLSPEARAEAGPCPISLSCSPVG